MTTSKDSLTDTETSQKQFLFEVGYWSNEPEAIYCHLSSKSGGPQTAVGKTARHSLMIDDQVIVDFSDDRMTGVEVLAVVDSEEVLRGKRANRLSSEERQLLKRILNASNAFFVPGGE